MSDTELVERFYLRVISDTQDIIDTPWTLQSAEILRYKIQVSAFEIFMNSNVSKIIAEYALRAMTLTIGPHINIPFHILEEKNKRGELF